MNHMARIKETMKTSIAEIKTDWYVENNIGVADCVGIDEVGRGPLAGPVVAAAVWIDEIGVQTLRNSGLVVRDSKKMTATLRQKVVDWIKTMSDSPEGERHVKAFIAQASVDEIDSMNILHATMLAMQRAYTGLGVTSKFILVDGNRGPNIPQAEVKTVIKGDDKVLAISLASIIAKQYRDGLMHELAKKYPQYGWDANVGYGTKQHIQAINEVGITEHHRKSFSPVKEIVAAENPSSI